MVLYLPWKPHSWHSTHVKLFKRSQFAIKCRCILWKIIHNGPILMKLYQSVLGVRFFLKHSVYITVKQTNNVTDKAEPITFGLGGSNEQQGPTSLPLSTHVPSRHQNWPPNSHCKSRTILSRSNDDEIAYFTVRLKTRTSFAYRSKNMR